MQEAGLAFKLSGGSGPGTSHHHQAVAVQVPLLPFPPTPPPFSSSQSPSSPPTSQPSPLRRQHPSPPLVTVFDVGDWEVWDLFLNTYDDDDDHSRSLPC